MSASPSALGRPIGAGCVVIAPADTGEDPSDDQFGTWATAFMPVTENLAAGQHPGRAVVRDETFVDKLRRLYTVASVVRRPICGTPGLRSSGDNTVFTYA